MRTHSCLMLLLAVVLLLAWQPAILAEQIKLADGRYLQGEVGEVKEDGFVFKLTESGGQVFLRWNQVDAGLKQRLRNEKDPDEGLNLDVTVEGARLELIDGTVHEGKITRSGNTYIVSNRDRARLSVNADDVVEEGFIDGIEIDATRMMTEAEALALAEERRAPLETARQYYELARIGDRLGLYEEALDYVNMALQAAPDSKLQARLAEYETKLAELIRQKGVLTALITARQLAKKNKYQRALDLLQEAREEFKPTDAVLEKWTETNAEIDLDFTKFVITEWHKVMKPVVQAKLKGRDARDMTVAEAMNWARREMELDIQKRIAAEVMSEDTQNIKVRFAKRGEMHDAKVIRLSTRKVGFGEDGFYQIVGGHLPVAGKQPQQSGNSGQNPNNPPRRGPGGSDPRFPGSEKPIDWDKFDPYQFQEAPRGPSEDEIREALRRALENEARRQEGAGSGSSGNTGPARQDISKLKVPNVVPSLNDWWEKAGTSRRVSWLMAVYVKFGGTMQVLELSDWDIRYR